MPRSSPIQTSFNAGKWGPRLQGRVDLEKYSSACNELKNFIPTVQGPALKRSGTRFVKTVKDQFEKSRLIPFEFSTEQAYVLELYEGGMRVLKDLALYSSPRSRSPTSRTRTRSLLQPRTPTPTGTRSTSLARRRARSTAVSSPLRVRQALPSR